ncbi:alpha/beta hydrolase [Streptomyces sp. Z26]|uniref:alpha/beta hydrolase n=1 Tax=Streptomyces sp. Z26 TaxID=2500177 RepID=UPI000EF132F2|nr:alpha/beta hydrolase [Streptomyces sp. Z26]RLL69033.1 hypothetical protein D7M15_21870 [Streptomyces sp. Z26]
MLSYRTLRQVKPAEFEQAADGYHAVSTAARVSKDRLAHQIVAKTFPDPAASSVDKSEGLVGEGASAARARLTRLTDSLHYTQVECGLISAALNAFAAELRAAKKKLRTAELEARNAGFTVDGTDGSVSWRSEENPFLGQKGVTSQDSWVPLADPEAKRVEAQTFADRIGRALADAAEADERWAPKLRRLKAQNDLTVSAADWADVHGDQGAVQKVATPYLDESDIPRGRDPEDNAAWWKGLSAQEQADYVSLYPASVGALDGVPADVRDEANRAVLAEKKGHYQLELASIPPKPGLYAHPGGSDAQGWREQRERVREWEEKYGSRKDRLERNLRGISHIDERFAATGNDGLPPAYLLGFDATGEGNGKVILANGNPDHADHTAVFVPGTGTDLGQIGGNIERGERLWTESNRMSPDTKISTVLWFDYDAPDGIREAAQGSRAENGGPRLRSFLEGTGVAHDGSDGRTGGAHTTVIGHSYGSTTIGEAAYGGSWKDKPLADDMLFVGSPGVQQDHAADLGIGAEHVWAMGGAWDDHAVRLGGRAAGHGDDFIIPTDERFGGNVMRSDSPDHSGFWNEESLSLRNQAAVITGRDDRAELE